MNVQKSDDFIGDVERQYQSYKNNAGLEVAEAYLVAVESTCRLLGQHPQLGPRGGFSHPRLREWRFFIVFRPFNKHILLYELVGDNVVMRRAMHGHRDLPRRLLERPASDEQ
jgi:plasmid stabilization system protein ParE